MTEQEPPKNQFIPLNPLSTIVEPPKQDPSRSSIDTNSRGSIQPSQGVTVGTLQGSDQVAKAETTDSMEKHENPLAKESSRFPESREAASIPLPSSPAADGISDSPDPLQSAAPMDDSGSIRQSSPPPEEPETQATEEFDRPNGEERGTWASRLSSILPQAMFEQPTGQSTDTANSQAPRTSSLAPGAYPESESMEETPKPTPDSDMEEFQAEASPSKTNLPGKSTRPRKSVSIILPDADNDAESTERTKTDRSPTKVYSNMNLSGSSLDTPKNGTEADKGPQVDIATQNVRSRQTSQVEKHEKDGVDGSDKPEKGNETETSKAVSAPQPDPELFLKPSQLSRNADGLPISPASSIAASQEETDKTDWLTLHERESLAPSDADNSSLNPLLSSSPRYARSSHFSESLGDHRSELMPAESEKGIAPNHKTDADSPPVADDSSSVSTVISSTSSRAEKTGMKRGPSYPFPPIDDDEGQAHAESSHVTPTPKIVIKDASEVESSRQSPPLRAPATTPIQGSSPHRRTTFIALGEPSNQGPVKLPMKRRKLYLRKARYHVLRQPVLNAALGRQVGAQAKSALKKLANGELIIIEPPASL